MASQILAIEAMTDDDCTFSIGVVHGGKWVNCVSSLCTAEALSMAKKQADLDRGVERMLALSSAEAEGDVTFSVSLALTRPVWEPSPATLAMVEKAQTIAKSIGFDLSHQSAGAGSDANFTGPIGIATLDGLGAVGAGYHTLNEHIEVPSLVQRGKLFAGLLTGAELTFARRHEI